jgi:RsiW-degrading membrane proteinase PrsW (M82 family)
MWVVAELIALDERERKEVAALVFATTPLPKARPSLLYLVFLAFFAALPVLLSVFFDGRQPQPHGLFFLAISAPPFYV